jgi:HSP20 family protein
MRSRTGRDPGTAQRVEQAEEPSWSTVIWTPPTDVLLSDDAVIVRIELAGTAPADVQVRATSAELMILGYRREPPGPRPRRIDRMEIAFGPFERTIPLPAPVLPESARARLADGLLEVSLPLAEPHRAAPPTEMVLIILSERR